MDADRAAGLEGGERAGEQPLGQGQVVPPAGHHVEVHHRRVALVDALGDYGLLVVETQNHLLHNKIGFFF